MASKSSSGKDYKNYHQASTAGAGGVWFLGFLGSLIYYWQHSNSFWLIIVGLFKAIFWPAYLVYYLTAFLKI